MMTGKLVGARPGKPVRVIVLKQSEQVISTPGTRLLTAAAIRTEAAKIGGE